jgi:protein-disulfide isomerase
MKNRVSLAAACLLATLLVAGCGTSQKDLDKQATQVVADVFGTLTAAVPTSTLTPLPSDTPTPTVTPTQSATPTLTVTPTPWPSNTPTPTVDKDMTATSQAQTLLDMTATAVMLQQMIDDTVNTRVALLVPTTTPIPPTPTVDKDMTATSQAQTLLDMTATAVVLQQMIDDTVNTRVALLIQTTTPIPPTPTVIPRGVVEGDAPFLGPKDAPVVIVEFADFQCQYCGRWYQETLPQILHKYPQQVKFVYRNFTIFGEDSVRAAEAAECANDQGKFWEMHNRLFDHTVNHEQTALSQDTLVGYAKDLGLDTRSFGECLTSRKYLSKVEADYQAAVSYGLPGTPGFVINGVVYAIGAQPFSVFDEIIQNELAKNAGSG